jgi:iron complex outermembrane recepter protein
MGIRLSISCARIVALALFVLASPLARAQAVIEFNMPPQPLADALGAVAKQTDLNILIDRSLVAGRRAPELRARLTAAEALSRLLQGSGIAYRFVDEHTVTLLAQADAAADSTQAPVPSTTSTYAPPGEALEEIVVTAQKRSEKMQDVPASVSVLSGRQIENLRATQLADYAAYVPGLTLTGGGTPGQVSLTLRGLSAMGPTTQVATYIDETPVGSSAGWAREASLSLDMLPYDVERIEILRGPQGTLYGSNSMGGLLKYVLRAPDLEAFSARVGTDLFAIHGADDAEYENIRGMVNVPLMIDRLALRASAFHQKTPGYIDNPLTGERDENAVTQQGGRLALLWQATDELSVKLQATAQRIEADDNASVRRDLDVSGGPGQYRPLGPSEGDLSYAHPLAQPFHKEIEYFAATVNWDLPLGTFTAASSYSTLDTQQVADFSDTFGSVIPLLTDGEVAAGRSLFTTDLQLDRYTQELRLASPAGQRFEWLVGLYYSNEDSENSQLATGWDVQNQPVPGADPLGIAELPSTYEEIAAFANVTYQFTHRFSVTAGVRQARNEQSFHQFSAGPLAGGVFDALGHSEESVTTYAVSPRWRINDDVMIYARLATGYRPGGPNVVFPGVPPERDADSTTNYEVGIKSELLDRRALLNVTAYRIDWKDMQLNAIFGGVGAVVNGKSARSQGLELESAYSPISGLRLGFTAAYTDATIAQDMLQPPSIDWRNGDRLPYAPKWSAALQASHEFPAFADWNGTLNAGLRYIGSRFNAVEGDALNTRLVDYTILDLAGGIENERCQLKLYVKNVFDKRAYSSDFIVTDINNTPLYVVSQVLQPRTVGVGIDVNF